MWVISLAYRTGQITYLHIQPGGFYWDRLTPDVATFPSKALAEEYIEEQAYDKRPQMRSLDINIIRHPDKKARLSPCATLMNAIGRALKRDAPANKKS